MKRRDLAKALVASALIAVAPTGFAQPGGHATLRIIVPFAPGGSGDITARMLGEQITKKTGQAVVVENKPGANGIIGVETAKHAPSDGSVLMLATTSTHLANPSLFRNLPYDPEKDFTLVGHFGSGSTFVLVNKDAPYRTLADFVAHAKRHPSKLNYGHFNASSNIPGAMINQLAGIELMPIPYKQIGSAMNDLIGGSLDVIFVDSVAGDSYVSSGQLRAIAAMGASRLPKYPDVPLLTETYPDYNVAGGFLGIAVPRGVPEATLQALNDLINEIVTTDPMKTQLEKLGFHPKRLSLAELAGFVTRERANWRSYVDIAKIAPQ
ncbi:MAG: tripartite tricarboxylate transporter substrate binding protein [Limnobacter sp.]|nr:tripartite tricarboxylate transporter substrate binding protein [Limnobacter sp.]